MYERCSSPMINFNKYSIMFSKNTSVSEKEEVMQQLGGMTIAIKDKYLGLPLIMGRSKNQVFTCIMEKVAAKLQGWKKNLLGQAGCVEYHKNFHQYHKPERQHLLASLYYRTMHNQDRIGESKGKEEQKSKGKTVPSTNQQE
ncbi:hypothetical protein ACH5RR_001346 [Cinchona calisaya]|uniref:Reverse transcriptase n=1 Tax=Cinchona calisaya TaxID=153742 RepID=A0ABD3B3P5_9GENT